MFKIRLVTVHDGGFLLTVVQRKSFLPWQVDKEWRGIVVIATVEFAQADFNCLFGRWIFRHTLWEYWTGQINTVWNNVAI